MNTPDMNLKIQKNTVVIGVAVIVAVIVAVAVVVMVMKRRTKREGFSFSSIGNAFKNFGKGVASSSVNLYHDVSGTGPSPSPPPYVPTYSGRQYDGNDWSCPSGTVDTGLEDARGCAPIGQYMPPLWRWDGTQWGWSCPNWTVPTDSNVVGSQWEKKCLVGFSGRMVIDGTWTCPQGTTDTGHNWNDPYYVALQQCQRSGGAYTVRVSDGKGGWMCPAGSKDTGLGWSSPSNQWNQCKWIGG